MSTSETTQENEKNREEQPESGCSGTTDQHDLLNDIFSSIQNGADEETKKRIADQINKEGDKGDPLGMGLNPAEILGKIHSGDIASVMPQLKKFHTRMGDALKNYDKRRSDNSGERGE